MDWGILSKYLSGHPLLFIAVAVVSGLAPSIVALFVGRLQARSAIDTERLKLRREISLRWLKEFDEAAGVVRKSLDALAKPSQALDLGEATEVLWTFKESYPRLLSVCSTIAFSFPGHWIVPPLVETAASFQAQCDRLTTQIQEALMEDIQMQSRSLRGHQKARSRCRRAVAITIDAHHKSSHLCWCMRRLTRKNCNRCILLHIVWDGELRGRIVHIRHQRPDSKAIRLQTTQKHAGGSRKDRAAFCRANGVRGDKSSSA